MSSPNGQPQGEPVNYGDVLEYWREQVLDLHSRLSVCMAQLKSRDREIQDLREQLNKGLVEKPGG